MEIPSLQHEAIALNNYGLSLFKGGDLWKACETFHQSLVCLDLDKFRLEHCTCRGCHLLVPNDASHMNTMEWPVFNDDIPVVHAYEWIDCKPETSSMINTPRSVFPQHGATKQQMPNEMQGLTPSSETVYRSNSHESRLSLLSFGAIKIHARKNQRGYEDYAHRHIRHDSQHQLDDSNKESSVRGIPFRSPCDCAIRWAALYNLGIISQTLGSCMGERGHGLLHRAEMCYDLAHSTIPAHVSLEHFIRFVISSQNNRMVIFQEFGMHAEFNSSVQALVDLIVSIPVCHTLGLLSNEPSTILDHHDVLLNLMVMVRTESAPAA